MNNVRDFIRGKSPHEIQQILSNAYLGLGWDTSQYVLKNPLLDASEWDLDHPHIHILQLMRNPDYFPFTTKWLFNVELLPFQAVILKELWNRTFPMLIASRGGGKTWLMSLYALIRALFHQGSKIVIVGAAFRQSKLLFEYMESFWRQSPIFRQIVGEGKHQGPKRDVDRCTFYVGDSVIHAIPLGDGSKIRGLRASITIADEFPSIPVEVFETVVGGFSSVRLDPVVGVKEYARTKLLKETGLWIHVNEDEENELGNQLILSGTAYYAFNHFADYWSKYKRIIQSKGNLTILNDIFKGDIPEGFDWKKYGIVRVPYHKLPKGFMDETHVARAKATVHSSIYQMEYGACFCTDSQGFFRRSLIEACVMKPDYIENNPNLPAWCEVFRATLRGNPNLQYVIGIDPSIGKAAGTGDTDNFAIVVLELHPTHKRIVYCWTATQAKHKEKVKKGIVKERDFYSYCARKIRDLARIFPTQHIGMDAQGGGTSIMEALQDPTRYNVETENAILPYIAGKDDPFWWEIEDKPTDRDVGDHIVHVVQFAKADWTYQANHGLRKDIEDKTLLFPFFDPLVIEEAIRSDQLRIRSDNNYRLHDTLEDCVMNIEELKDELTTIEHTQTTNGRDRWDTPEVVEGGGRKSHLRKDRYSALLIANMVARIVLANQFKPEYSPAGGYVGQPSNVHGMNTPMYIGPSNLVNKMRGTYGMGIRRRV